MTENKRKFTTALLTTALLSCGFSIDTERETRQETEKLIDSCVTKEETKQLDLVVEEDAEDNLKTNSTVETTLYDTKARHQQADSEWEDYLHQPPDIDPHELELIKQSWYETDIRTTNRQKATPSTTKSRHQTDSKEEDSNTGKPDTPEPVDTLQVASNDFYDLQETEAIETDNAVITVTYPTTNSTSTFVPGFGWIEDSGEPNTQILALDMYESGVKVGSMGGS